MFPANGQCQPPAVNGCHPAAASPCPYPTPPISAFCAFYQATGFDSGGGTPSGVNLMNAAPPTHFWTPVRWPTVISTAEFSRAPIAALESVASVDEHDGVDGSNAANGTKRRVLFRKEQVELLERTYLDKGFINAKERHELARKCGLRPDQVKIWFQNRRYKQKKKNKDLAFLASRALAKKMPANGEAMMPSMPYPQPPPPLLPTTLPVPVTVPQATNNEIGRSSSIYLQCQEFGFFPTSDDQQQHGQWQRRQ